MLELYHNDMSSCAQKVRLTLAEDSENHRRVMIEPSSLEELELNAVAHR